MDFLVSVFRSAFFGHDFSVLIFWSGFFLLCALVAVMCLAASETLMSKERVPWWGWGTLLISSLSLPILYLLFVV